MEALANFTLGLDFFAREAQALCAAINPDYRAHCNACKCYATPAGQTYFAITVFDSSTAHYGKPCGDIAHQTDYNLTTPEAALEALAAAYGRRWPLLPEVAATRAQQEEIIRLLNHPKINRREKTLTLVELPRYSGARATERITELRAAIEQAENAPLAQAA